MKLLYLACILGATSAQDESVKYVKSNKKRCDKDSGTSDKICSSKKLTPCTLSECEILCDERPGQCEAFSFEKDKGNCYLFSQCLFMDDEKSYDTYVLGSASMSDEYSLEPCNTLMDGDSPGCTRRRCVPKTNENEKVCASKSDSSCSLEDCQRKCAIHDNFMCSHFAFDPSKGDCYLFETCDTVEHNLDYNLYAMAITTTQPKPASLFHDFFDVPGTTPAASAVTAIAPVRPTTITSRLPFGTVAVPSATVVSSPLVPDSAMPFGSASLHSVASPAEPIALGGKGKGKMGKGKRAGKGNSKLGEAKSEKQKPADFQTFPVVPSSVITNAAVVTSRAIDAPPGTRFSSIDFTGLGKS